MSTAGIPNEVLLNAAHIMEACKDATQGDIEVAVYDRLLYHVCPDPKNASFCKVVEDGYLKGEFVSKQKYWLSNAQYASDDFWLVPRPVTTVAFPSNVLPEEALVNLWKATKAVGLGVIHASKVPSIDDAKSTLLRSTYVDYLNGKPIKTDFRTYPTLTCTSYDRDAGAGTMAKVATNSAEEVAPYAPMSESDAKALVYATKVSFKTVDE